MIFGVSIEKSLRADYNLLTINLTGGRSVGEARNIRRRQWCWWMVVLLLLPLAVIYGAGTVETLPGRHLFDCPFRQWFGLPCAGCGLTHAFFAFFHGHWRPAWEANPLFPLLLLGWLGLVVHFLLLALDKRSRILLPPVYGGLLLLLAVGTVALWVVRVFFGWFPAA